MLSIPMSLIRRKSIEKLSSMGDIVNAGYGSMCMGSPFSPRPFASGTNSLKPTGQLQDEQRNTAIGGLAGLATSYFPYSLPNILKATAAADAAGKLYACAQPKEGTTQYYVNKGRDYVRDVRMRAHDSNTPASAILMNDASYHAVNSNALMDSVSRYVNDESRKPLSITERIENPTMRNLAEGAENFPIVGNAITFAKNVDRERQKGTPMASSLGKSFVRSFPFYRSFVSGR